MAALAALAPSAAATDVAVGFLDDSRFASSEATVRSDWLTRASAVGAQKVRLNLRWARVAESEPPPERADDPSWPGYVWGTLDEAVRDAAERGLSPIITFLDAPSWAQRGDAPPSADAGTWRPDPAALQAFARAVGRRYSGTFSPEGRAALPAVRAWQSWNEPNLASYLAPQWVRIAGRWRAESPRLYRGLHAAVYRGLKSVSQENVVATGGTAPFGDLSPGGRRIMPARFVREFLCIEPAGCQTPKLDALSHHPYGVGGPHRRALNRDDVTIPDLGKLQRLLRRARLTVPIWVTEFSWDSSPSDPDGVPEQRHARWLAGSLYEFWRRNVQIAIWLGIGDQAPVPSFGSSYQSGVYLMDGRPKPAARAMGFPFVGEPLSRGQVRIWGMTPRPTGTVTIERRRGRGWRKISTLQARDRVFTEVRRIRRGATLRAVAQGTTSLSWKVGVSGG